MSIRIHAAILMGLMFLFGCSGNSEITTPDYTQGVNDVSQVGIMTETTDLDVNPWN